MIKGKNIEWRSLRDGSDGILGCVDRYSFYEIHEQVLGDWSISFVLEPNRPTIYDIVSLAEAKKQCDVLLETFINDIVADHQGGVVPFLMITDVTTGKRIHLDECAEAHGITHKEFEWWNLDVSYTGIYIGGSHRMLGRTYFVLNAERFHIQIDTDGSLLLK